MKFICPSGVGRLMRAAICGLLAAIVIPAAGSAEGIVGEVTGVTPVATTQTPSASATPTRVRIPKRGKQKSKPAKTQHSSSTRSFMSADSFRQPFTPLPFQNPCVLTDWVTITGSVTTTLKLQPDGSFWLYQSYSGTGISWPSGAKYAFSDEVHGAFVFPFTDPPTPPIRFYDYYKLNRQADIVSPLGGDDFFLRIYTEIQGSTGGGPSMNSLMTDPIDGECR
jgi:hypothetical protein